MGGSVIQWLRGPRNAPGGDASGSCSAAGSRVHCTDDGRFAQVGRDMVNGFEMYLDEVKGDFAGTKVKLILEDDQARPPTGVLKAEKLIRQDKVHILMGGVLATTGYCAGSSEHAREDDIYTGCSCCR